MSEVTPMADGGVWLAEGGTGTPFYVVNEDHIERLLKSGYQVVADPRLPAIEPTFADELVAVSEQSNEPEQTQEKKK